MAYVDERTQKFLDNIISGASNEELFKMQRAPAGKPVVGPPTAAQDVPVVEPENIQGESVVEGSARVRPLEISTKALVGQTPDYMQNVNRSIEDVANLKNQYVLERQMAQEQSEKNQATLQGALSNLQRAVQPRVRTPEEIERLRAANEGLKDIKDAPNRDMMSEAILSFGPALLGSLTGESGALAAPAAAKQARDLYETGRKEDIASIQKKNEQILKNYENILKIDKQSAEDYLNNQKLLQQQADVAFKGAATMGQMSQKEAQAYDQKIVELQKAEAAATQKGAEKVAAIEGQPAKDAAALKRAQAIAKMQQSAKPPTEGERKGAFQYGLTAQAEQNIQDVVKKYGGYPSMKESFYRTKKDILAGNYSGVTMTDFLNKFVKDPGIRSQIQGELQFLESVGRIQSGAAIRPDEWLSLRAQYFPSFGDNQDSINFSEQQRKQALAGIKTIAGKAPISEVKSVITPIDQKVIGGVTYKKVNGGWQKVK